jgi:adenylosuccinate synthase
MSVDVVLGGQWGDEGKGKIVDRLAAGVDAVVRCQGGANAGHTLVEGDEKLALHLIPSGVRHEHCLLVLGAGMVVDPLALLEEIEALEASGYAVRQRLRVSVAAHVVLPSHRLQDQAQERRRGAGSVGTTGRGIGPTYADKAARTGIRLGTFLLPEAELRDRTREILRDKQSTIEPAGALDLEATLARLVGLRAEIAPLLCDTTELLHELDGDGRNILLEGAQGTMLDLDHGSYPFVTSSSCTTAGALAGCGLAPQRLREVVGVFKAYCTRVGNGPFPSELHDAVGEKMREVGREFGTTTGRPRRCGWFDVVAARYAARLNGFTQIALTKLDVLDDFEEVQVVVAYDLDGETIHHLPADAETLARCTPVTVGLQGWKRAIGSCRDQASLPDAARRYLAFLEERTGVPIRLVSVGPERADAFARA